MLASSRADPCSPAAMKIMTTADVANSCHSHELQHNNPSFPTTMNEASNYHETLK
jgi:hypothetical protein